MSTARPPSTERPSFDPLDPTRDCPLLAEGSPTAARELADLLNDCGRQLAELADGRARAVLDRDEGRKIVTRYDRARKLLQREKYRVGFLGTSQAGKSTIFNRVLKEVVATSGSGLAMTALPSRLSRGPAKRCELHYMSARQYRERLRQLCIEVGIGDSTVPEDDLLRQVGELRPTVAGAGDGQRPVRPEDIDYLKEFLATARTHQSYVRDGEPRVDEVPFDSRAEYINHAPTTKAGSGSGPGLLLQEVRLFIPTENLPGQLELCDLPGVGVSRSVDTIVTRDFIKSELDGALIFINVATSLSTPEIKDLMRLLAAHCGDDLSGRVWLVANRCDSLSEPHYKPPTGQPSIFEAIIGFLDESKLQPDHICFTSNTLYEYADALPEKKLPTDKAADYMRLGDKPFPDSLPASLKTAWEALLTDGGVAHLRHLVTTDVASSVAEKIRADAHKDLVGLQKDIGHLVKAATATVAPTTRRNAVQCEMAILRLRDGLVRQPAEFSFLAQVRDELRTALAEQLCPDEGYAATIRTMSATDLARRYKVDALTLDELLDQILTTRAVDLVYEEIADLLAGVNNVPVGNYGGVLEAWDEYRRADRDDPSEWAVRVPKFRENGPFVNGHAHTGDDYLEILNAKVRVVVAQTVHGLRAQLRVRLGQLKDLLDPLLMTDTDA